MHIEMYYKMKNGNYIDRYELENAFYVTHGYYSFKDESCFLKWLYALLGKSIIAAFNEYDMQVEELAKSRPILAMKLYRNRYHCTLAEAKEYIEKIKDNA